jgi:hypothetical protein
MKVLILSNNAPDYHRFFNKLALRLEQVGHKVSFAVDCRYSRELNRLDETGLAVHTFSDYWGTLEAGTLSVAETRLAGTPCNIMHLPDYERAEIFGFNACRDGGYYDRLLASLDSFFERIIREEGVEAVIYENVSNTFAYAAWHAAKRASVQYIGLYVSRLPGRFEIVDDPFGESRIYQPVYDAIRCGSMTVPADIREKARDYLARFDEIRPDYMKFNDLADTSILRYAAKSKIRKVYHSLKRRRDDHSLSFQTGNPLRLSIRMFSRNIARIMRQRACRKFLTQPKKGEKYFLYPLHYHPESSTSVKSPYLIDELTVVRNLAISLPFGYRLYVKDHPSAFALPRTEFYRRISRLPNVRLIDHRHDTRNLIRRSAAVITQTSTVGYEALFYGKRVFLMGSDAYEFHPSVVKLGDPSFYFEHLQRSIDTPVDSRRDIDEDFVAAYFMRTHDGILNFNQDDDGLNRLVAQVMVAISTLLS